jgi:hypothetical protein
MAEHVTVDEYVPNVVKKKTLSNSFGVSGV